MLKLPYSTTVASEKRSKTSGFTLIELLIVIMVIGVLSGIVLSVINSQGIREKTRDSQRISDLKKIQTALELFFADNRNYPSTSGNWQQVTGSNALSNALSPSSGTQYLKSIPLDPTNNGLEANPCGQVDELRYNYWSDGNDYILTAIAEVSTSNDDNACSNLNVWGSNCSSGFDTQDFCIGVENP